MGASVTSEFCGQWVVFVLRFFLALYYKTGCYLSLHHLLQPRCHFTESSQV